MCQAIKTEFIHIFKGMTLSKNTRIILSKFGCHGVSLKANLHFKNYLTKYFNICGYKDEISESSGRVSTVTRHFLRFRHVKGGSNLKRSSWSKNQQFRTDPLWLNVSNKVQHSSLNNFRV